MENKSKKVEFHPILMHFAARFSNKTYRDFASDYRVLVETNIKCMEYFKTNAVGVISDPYRETSAFGAGVEYPLEGVPRCLDKLISTIDDVKSLQNPDVYKAERTRDRIEGAKYYRKLLGASANIFGWIEGPLAEACDLTGLSEMLMKLALEPDFSKLLMEKCIITAKDFAKAQVENGCNIIGVGDAICSQISADMYRDNVMELHKELFAYIHSLKAKVKLHICGNITHLLDYIKETRPDIVDIDWMVNINTAHEKLGAKIFLSGNLDPVSVIERMNPEEVYAEAKKLIENEKGKAFIMSGGCEITVRTSKDNLLAITRAVNE